MKSLEFEKPIADLESEILKLKTQSDTQDIDLSTEISSMEQKLTNLKSVIYDNLTPWQRVQIARHPNRPFMLDYLAYGFTDFVELHGDRHIGDDRDMRGGCARTGGEKGVVLGHQHVRDTKAVYYTQRTLPTKGEM